MIEESFLSLVPYLRANSVAYNFIYLSLTLWIAALTTLVSAVIIPRQAGLIVHHELTGKNLALGRNVEEFALRQRNRAQNRHQVEGQSNTHQKRVISDTVNAVS